MAFSPRHRARLSIGLPVYNGERYLSETLDCVRAQTFGEFEVVICDNASTDRTAEICRSYAEQDSRIRCFRNERNLGAIPNYNKVFRLCSAPLFKWIADDDLYHPEYLETCVGILDQNPDVVLAHSRTMFVDDRGSPFPAGAATDQYIDPKTGVAQTCDSPVIGDAELATVRFWQVLSRARWGTHMFGVIRRDMLQRTGLLPNFGGSDRAMLAELALLGRFQSANRVLYSKRFHGRASLSLNQKELLGWLSTDRKAYSRRARQLKNYLSAPFGKRIGPIPTACCMALVVAHSIKTAGEAIGGKDARFAAEALAWRTTNSASPR